METETRPKPEKPLGHKAYIILALGLIAAGYIIGRSVPSKDRLQGFGLNYLNADGIWWSKGREETYLQDETGQVFWLRQVEKNNNIYEVWFSMGETNGITNSFSHRCKAFFGTNRNVNIIVDWDHTNH